MSCYNIRYGRGEPANARLQPGNGGNATGAILAQEVLARRNVDSGDETVPTGAPEGHLLTAHGAVVEVGLKACERTRKR